jgi:hypothetical protein
MSTHEVPAAVVEFFRQRAPRPAQVRLRSRGIADIKDPDAFMAAWLEDMRSRSEANATQASELAELRKFLDTAQAADRVRRNVKLWRRARRDSELPDLHTPREQRSGESE